MNHTEHHQIFADIDSKTKAYFLGLIASDDSTNKIRFIIHKHLLDIWRSLYTKPTKSIRPVCGRLPMLRITCSEPIDQDIRKHIGFNDENPSLRNSDLYKAFYRGLFENHGYINSRSDGESVPYCIFHLKSENMANSVKDFFGLNCTQINNDLKYHGYNAIDFLSALYDGSNELCFPNNYLKYVDWVDTMYQTPEQHKIPSCSFYKTEEGAVDPVKKRASDIGYDLTIIRKIKNLSPRTAMYETGIKVVPPFGFYTKIVARSSLVKTGYILTNSVGIIDPTYSGSIKIVLTKVDESMPDITLPFRCTQLIIDRAIHYEMICKTNITDLESTTRGDGGFGSTN